MSEPDNSTQRLPAVEKSPSADLEPLSSATAYRPPGSGGRAGRFWSRRRIPAGLLALLLLAAAGVLLYDVSAVRAGRPAMHWRRVVANDLATRPLDNIWIKVGAGVAMAIGLWLIVLALTPGLRSLLSMRRDSPQVKGGLERDAAALVLRDRAMEVAGVQSVHIRVKRSRVKARARSHFRELDDVRADLDAALDAGITELGLASSPGLSVRVGRPARKG
ncbi:DUF6286 domain-containing protein [Streptomyces sp. NBC_01387]|uniref:DUF6286 domain-containing protein n=1 Tax=unclassified Streptomyces TaxID=2593676 RepID=UPI002024157D|nr:MULTISPECIES: DUF6286 domain-containing protein [unclassified Streptomyces]MCX4551883.1 DUF6286 domain-containing protein [Streptomyces sp. NBC_01500]WSC23246.1 DUF6286 domain-containing protein [Streptomyces sp. NBC_01766]